VDLAEHRRKPTAGGARVGAQNVHRLLQQAVADPRIPSAPLDRDVREQPATARRVVLRRSEPDDLVEPAGRCRDDEVEDRGRVAAGAPQCIAMRLEVFPLFVPWEAAFVQAAG
jgi:hypothetical protein